MGEIIVGIFAVLIGGLFALQGGNLLRIMMPLFGFFAGFSAGAGMISGVTGDGFLATALGWAVGLSVALLFAVLAYAFYAFAVILVFAGFGFALTAGLLNWLNMDWNWLVLLLGTVVAIAFGAFAATSKLPMTLLIVLTSFFAASLTIYGIMLVLNIASFGDFSNGTVYATIHDSIGLYILWLLFGFMASVTQLRIFGVQTQMAQDYWNSSLTFDEYVATVAQPTTKKPTKKA